MKRKNLFNDGWEFALAENNSVLADSADLDYKPVDIPHDWLIYDTYDLYKSNDGFYRKTFVIDDISSADYILYFDGVYMNSTVFINGEELYTQTHGYASFQVNISDHVQEGENRIDVIVRHQAPNSRWYSGAGIFRNVYLYKLSTVHINVDGVYISPNPDTGDIYISAELSGVSSIMPPMKLIYTALSEDGTAIARGEKDVTWSCCETVIHAENYKLWSLDEPNLYTLKTELIIAQDGTVLDCSEDSFGFRKIVFDPDNGFSLNGKEMKLKGVCLHHDLGCLGAAFNTAALERQLMLMKDMGVNSVRTSHNMPAPELMELCDRIGMLVDDEAFDMWELPKTEFDNARFFKDTAPNDVMKWVKRDRNHPCLIMWSIGNEIYDTHADDHGYEIAEMLKDNVRRYDYKKNAAVTIASNFIEWERSQRIGEMLGVSGYNYTERCYDEHHKKYPSTVIYGSETSSAVRSRGIYHFPADVPQLTHDDHQCSSLANSCVVWGKPAEEAWILDRDRKFCCGQYIWTGIDYIGEPTPYSTKNSYFGAVDTAGIPKDIYYFYQSVWTSFKDKPMIHLLPYWDYNDGQLIDVIAYTNAPSCELFVNGRSLGVTHIDHEKGDILHAHSIVPYEAGYISAKAYDEKGNTIAEDIRYSFTDPVSVSAKPERAEIKADGEDIVFVEISVTDKNDRPVENARNRVTVFVEGAGVLMGTDNGDSTDYDQYKTNSRRLFSGKAVAAIRSLTESGDIIVRVESEGLQTAQVIIKAMPAEIREGISCNTYVECIENTNKEVPVRAIKACSDINTLTKDSPTAEVTYKLLPENATFADISCEALKPGGIKTACGKAELKDGKVIVTGLGDGEFNLRMTCNNGSKYPQIISEIRFSCNGLGAAVRSPYGFNCANTFSSGSDELNFINNNAISGFGNSGFARYDNFDFGRAGSSEVILHMGHNTNKDIPVRLYAEQPERTLIGDIMFPDNKLWEGFAPMSFKLSRTVRGMQDIVFEIDGNLTFGGFEFVPNDEAVSEILPVYNDELYGDDYTIEGERIVNIGNNVVIGFNGIDFGEGVTRITITGRTDNVLNSIQLRTVKDGVQKTRLLEFKNSPEYAPRTFEIEPLTGVNDVSFVFLPGSKFDFESFRFEK
ncbi:MAG: glycoside hydrolase family 2 TIM barrel-domain containing protein [Oscillospiraceae bacterium]|nr:glycoside hydrolase family 2 TIM barrel-domain containing protein [Oscillospiraceae bacterium]